MYLAVVVLVALVVPLRRPTGGRPKAAMPQLDHRILGRLAPVAVAEAVGACSAVPLAGEQSQDPMGTVGEVRLLRTAGVAPEDTVPQPVEVADHEPCCGRDCSSAQQEAAERQLQVQKGAPRPEVQRLLHEGHLLALPCQLWLWWNPKRVDGYTNLSTREEGSVTKCTDQVGQLCCRSSHERRQWK